MLAMSYVHVFCSKYHLKLMFISHTSCVELKKNKYRLPLNIIVCSSDSSHINIQSDIDILEKKDIYRYMFIILGKCLELLSATYIKKL